MSLRQAPEAICFGLSLVGSLLLAAAWFALLDLLDWWRRRRARRRGR